MNKQFYHGDYNKGHRKEFTACVEIPTKENLRIDIWKLLGENPKAVVSYDVGIARVSPKDRYNRKTGRELSASRMQKEELKLVEIAVNDNAKTIVLSNERVMIVLEMKEDRDKVHLIEVQIGR